MKHGECSKRITAAPDVLPDQPTTTLNTNTLTDTTLKSATTTSSTTTTTTTTGITTATATTIASAVTLSSYSSMSPNSISIISTYAGTGTGSYSGDGGTATSAAINVPSGIAIDSSGNVYFNDEDNHRVRKITASTGIITTYAGTGSASYSGDGGAASSAALKYPDGLSIDSSGTHQ